MDPNDPFHQRAGGEVYVLGWVIAPCFLQIEYSRLTAFYLGAWVRMLIRLIDHFGLLHVATWAYFLCCQDPYPSCCIIAARPTTVKVAGLETVAIAALESGGT